MNEAQVQGLIRHSLAIAGSVAATIAHFSPPWGTAAQDIVEGLGSLAAGGAIIWSALSPEKKPQQGS